MNIHLLPHKTANHNILATELLVEHEESTSHDALKDFWRFGVHSAILISSLLHGVAHSLGHQHGVLGRDGGANGYPTACPQEVNPLQGTVMSIRVGASSAVWVDKHLDWKFLLGSRQCRWPEVCPVFVLAGALDAHLSTLCDAFAVTINGSDRNKDVITAELLLLFSVDNVSALRFIQLNV